MGIAVLRGLTNTLRRDNKLLRLYLMVLCPRQNDIESNRINRGWQRDLTIDFDFYSKLMNKRCHNLFKAFSILFKTRVTF
jgi:hypothetical protein